jgi:serine/threonine-protein kinase
VPIHDYGEVDGLLYIDMRMIDGTDLRKVLKRFGR